MANLIYKLSTSTGDVLCHKMRLADTFFSRLQGLMFSAELPDCDGLLLCPGNSIHTCFMRYPLDVVFLSKDFKIIKVIYDLSPWRMTRIYLSSFQVLEMKAGTLKKNLQPGERLEVVCIS